MLFDLAAWVVIILVGWAVGRGVLALLRVDRLRPGDRFVIATWLGVVALAVGLLAASIVAPLTPAVAAIVGGLLLSLGGIARSFAPRAVAAAPLRAGVRLWPIAAGTACLAIGAAALASDPVTLYDSLVYHVGIMRWLREHGTVPGMALVHNRLGHVSAWFALAAPFDHGSATNRAATVPLGVALVLVGLQTSIAVGRVAARRASTADWFVIVLVAALIWPVSARGAATPSPDVATNVLIVVSAWSVLVVSQRGRTSDVDREIGVWLIPLILAVGAATMKLFAIPAVVAAAGYVIVAARGSSPSRSVFRPVLVAGTVAAIVLAPFVAANVAASGCPAYPSPIGCTGAPWSVGAAHAADYAEYIRDVARWDRRGNIPPDSPLGWIIPWMLAHPIVTFLATVSPLVALLLLRRMNRNGRPDESTMEIAGARTVVALALLGIAFAAWQAPAPRFLYVVVLLIPAMAFSHWMQRVVRVIDAGAESADLSHRFAMGFASAAVAVGLAYGVASQKLNIRSAMTRGAPVFHVDRGDLLLPSAPETQPRLFRWRVNDVDVLTPVPTPIADTLSYQSVIAFNAAFEKCSTAPLPCTPYLPTRDVRLKRPEHGLSGGFVRTREPDLAHGVLICLGELSATTSAASITGAPNGHDPSRCRPNDAR